MIFKDKTRGDANTVAETSSKAWKILIADDEADVHEVTRYALANVTYKGRKIAFVSAYSGQETLAILSQSPEIALILLDVVMESDDAGLKVVKHLREQLGNQTTRIILRTGHPGQAPENRIVMDYDINDYKAKTELTRAKLFTAVIASLRSYELLTQVTAIKEEAQSENRLLKRFLPDGELENPEAFAPIKTMDVKVRSLFRYLELTAKSARAALITGETGVGKELVAKVMHKLSGRQGELVTVNVAGLDDNLFSDTLFGHEKGAFTGADKARMGLIEKAAGGTLFLDEIGDMAPESQVKLLRLLQDHQYYTLGSDILKQSDARILVATHHDLQERTQAGKFRRDLYYRLSTHQIEIPPLRERKGDIPLLTDVFVRKTALEIGRPIPRITPQFLSILEEYDFPGNIRELEALIFDAVNRCTGDVLPFDWLHDKIGRAKIADNNDANSGNRNFRLDFPILGNFPTLAEVTESVIKDAMDRTDGNQSVAAQLLGISRQRLNYTLKKMGIR